jgi:DNA-binding NarL/FixJ family response regulator
MTNKEIAQRLATTVSMVKWRTSRAFEKLQVRNRVQAFACLRQSTLMDGPAITLTPAGPMPEVLRDAERRILHLLTYGLTNAQIARSLGLTSGTVKWYQRELFGKLQARNRVEALMRARQQRWL